MLYPGSDSSCSSKVSIIALKIRGEMGSTLLDATFQLDCCCRSSICDVSRRLYEAITEGGISTGMPSCLSAGSIAA